MESSLLIKEKDRYRDQTLTQRFRRWRSYSGMAAANLGFLCRLAAGRIPKALLYQPHDLAPGFFGVNCPPSPAPELSDLMYGSLCQLGIRSIRVDWGYASAPQITSHWVSRLLDGGFDVLLHLVQPHHEASRMDQPEVRERWREFVRLIFDRFGARIQLYEIGSTPNRHAWAGYTIDGYAAACADAFHLAAQRGLQIAGPNTSDFAPYFTIGLLAACRRAGVSFAAMTDNLFVDRAGAPENYDPSVLGRRLRNTARMDLAGKSGALARIARAFGAPLAYSTYSTYTVAEEGKARSSAKRPWRYVSEETYADYLVRYYVLSAAAGALDRVYWGDLSSYYKGLMDDGYRHRPDPPTVYQKLENHGHAADYRKRPAFAALRHLVERLQDARFVAALSPRDPFVFQFERDGGAVIVAWSAKESSEPAPVLEEAVRRGAKVFTRDGQRAASPGPPILSGSPVYLLLPS